MSGLHPADSVVETTYTVLPPDTNHHGTAFGGKIMQWMDITAGIAAARHCGEPVVTVAVDDLHFARPIRLGEVVILKAAVNHTARTSMEVGVRVERENIKTREREHCLSGYFTFVSVDDEGRPTAVSPLEPLTADDIRRHDNAAKRRQKRLDRRSTK